MWLACTEALLEAEDAEDEEEDRRSRLASAAVQVLAPLLALLLAPAVASVAAPLPAVGEPLLLLPSTERVPLEPPCDWLPNPAP